MRIDIVDRGGRPSQALKEYVGLRLMSELDRLVRSVEVVSVSLAEVGAGGSDVSRCRMLAQLIPSGQLAAEHDDPGMYAAIDAAAEELARRLKWVAKCATTHERPRGRVVPSVLGALGRPQGPRVRAAVPLRIDIRARDVEMTDELRRHAQRRMVFAIGRFGGQLASVGVHLDDVNGPRGGADKRCRVTAHLHSGADVRIVEVDPHIDAAIDRAADRLRQGVARQVGRRREKQVAAVSKRAK